MKEIESEKDIIKDIQDSVDAILDRLDDIEDRILALETKIDLNLEAIIETIEKRERK